MAQLTIVDVWVKTGMYLGHRLGGRLFVVGGVTGKLNLEKEAALQYVDLLVACAPVLTLLLLRESDMLSVVHFHPLLDALFPPNRHSH